MAKSIKSKLLEEIYGRAKRPLAILEQFSVAQIIAIIRTERPQTAALVIAHLPGERAAKCLAGLDAGVRSDVIERIAKLLPVDEQVLTDLEELLQKRLEQDTGGATRDLGGVKKLVAMLTAMDEAGERKLLDDLEKRDPQMAALVRESLFGFEDLTRIEARGLQKLLMQISDPDLAKALRGSSSTVTELILQNLSSRRAEQLREDLQSGAAQHRDVIAEARRRIIALAKQLAEAGELTIERRAS